MAAGLVALFLGFLYATGQDLDAGARDQPHDLALALDIREMRALTDGNRHPLLPALLAPVASREPAFFVRARLLMLALTAAALAATWLGTSRVFGPGLALAALALSLFEVRLEARRVCPEPLLAALLVLAVSRLARAPTAPRPGRARFGAGALVGLAWLAKGSALLMLPAFALHLVATRRPGRTRALLQVLAGFVLVASPLLLWNVREYGSPFFNANTAHVAWEDRWDEGLDRTSTATLSSWLDGHSIGDGVSRLAHGLVTQRGIEWVLGFLAIALLARLALARPESGIGARADAPERSPPREWRRIAVCTCLVWWPAFAWYAPIVSSRRLLFPIFPLLLPPALDVLARLVPAVGRGVRVPRGVALAGALLLAAGGIALAIAAGLPDPARHVRPEASRFVARLPDPAGQEIRVLARPSRTVPPDWLFPRGYVLVGLPWAVRDTDVSDWWRTHVDALLLSEGLLRNRPGALEELAVWNEHGVSPAVGLEWWAGFVVERDARGRAVYVFIPTFVGGR